MLFADGRDAYRQVSGRLRAALVQTGRPSIVLRGKAVPLGTQRRFVFVEDGAFLISFRFEQGATPVAFATLLFAGELLDLKPVGSFPGGTVRALQDSSIRLIDEAQLLEVMRKGDPSLAFADLSSRLWARVTQQALGLAGLPAEARLATLLVKLALRLGQGDDGRILFDIPMTRPDMASCLGITPETLSRVLSKFRADGIVTMRERYGITIDDWARLCAATPLHAALVNNVDRGPANFG